MDTQPHKTHLYKPSDGFAVCWHHILLISMDDGVALCSPLLILWQVQVDLVSVKVCIEGVAVGVVHPDGALPLQKQNPLLVLTACHDIHMTLTIVLETMHPI